MTGPTFGLNTELTRYVNPASQLRGRRTAITAFLESPPEDRTKEYLSVNSLEVEGARLIAEYYRARFQSGRGPVAISTTTVRTFTYAGKKCGVDLHFDRSISQWLFGDLNGSNASAYKHHPLRASKDLKSESHCGVEFVRMLSEHRRSQFARLLSGFRFHLFNEPRRR